MSAARDVWMVLFGILYTSSSIVCGKYPHRVECARRSGCPVGRIAKGVYIGRQREMFQLVALRLRLTWFCFKLGARS